MTIDLARAQFDAMQIQERPDNAVRDVTVMQWHTVANGRAKAPILLGWAVRYWSGAVSGYGFQLYPGEISAPERSLYIVDDGRNVAPFYVAGWRDADSPRITLHPFPTNDGRLRPDNGQPVDFTGWMLTPRRAFHLKIVPVHVAGCTCTIDNAYGRTTKISETCRKLRNG